VARKPQGLSPIMQRIFWFVALRPWGVTKPEIFDHLYGDDPDGGPFDHIMDVHICHLNTRLKESGLRVAKLVKRKHNMPYQLRRIDNGHIWLPLQLELEVAP
jgi:DNA-binding response OmpR family regulator